MNDLSLKCPCGPLCIWRATAHVHTHRMRISLRKHTSCLVLASDTQVLLSKSTCFFCLFVPFCRYYARWSSTPSDSGIASSAPGPSTSSSGTYEYPESSSQVAVRSGTCGRSHSHVISLTSTAARPGHPHVYVLPQRIAAQGFSYLFPQPAALELGLSVAYRSLLTLPVLDWLSMASHLPVDALRDTIISRSTCRSHPCSLVQLRQLSMHGTTANGVPFLQWQPCTYANSLVLF